MVPGLEGLQQAAPELNAPNSRRMSRPLQIFGGGPERVSAPGASSGGLLGRGGVELATDRGGELGQVAVALDAPEALLGFGEAGGGPPRTWCFTALIWAALRFGPTQWSRPSRVRASARRARRSAGGWSGSCTTTGPSSLRRSADGVADQPGERRLHRHRARGVLASGGRRAACELAAEGR
jgi:hypothetical protein